MELNIPLRYKKDLDTAVEILKEEGCQSIYLFGSLVTGNVHENSDIDIGIKGLPPEKFLGTFGKVHFAIDTKVDIVDFDFEIDFYRLLDRLGEVVEIG